MKILLTALTISPLISDVQFNNYQQESAAHVPFPAWEKARTVEISSQINKQLLSSSSSFLYLALRVSPEFPVRFKKYHTFSAVVFV